MRMKYLSLLILIPLLHILHGQAAAETMQGSGYKLETNMFNTFTKQKIIVDSASTSNVSKEQESVPENNQSPVIDNQSLSLPFTLSISVDPTSLDFGVLSAGEAIQRSMNIQMMATRGAIIQIAELTPLMSGETVIPDTTCDSGECTPATAGHWENPLVFGFGYTCTSNTKCLGFDGKQSYKPLANLSEGMAPQNVITTYGPENTATDLNFKVNIPPTSEGKEYNNTITLYALPNY